MRKSRPWGPGSTRARTRGAATRALVVGLAAAGLAVAAPADPAAAGGIAAISAGEGPAGGRHVDHLQVDDLTAPLGIDDTAPQLSWQVSGGTTAAVQTGYEVRAATSRSLLDSGNPDLWDSGRVASPQSADVKYAGKALDSREDVYWQVRTWTAAGVSGWSAPSSWEMGLLASSDWSAKWIEDPLWTAPTNRWPVFGTTFTVKSKPAEARLYVTGLGMETTTINGRPIGDAVLEPGESDYKTQVQYRTYDVASLLHPGINRIEIATGSGWYLQTAQAGQGGRFGGLGSNNGETGAPRVVGQLEITQHDGSRQTIATGPNWLTAFGPTTFSSWFGGEDYNAQVEQQVGDVPAGADSRWTNAADSVLYGTVSQPTSATGNTTLAQSASAGATNIKVDSVTGAAVGAPVTVGTGTTKEVATITSVGTPSATTPLATTAAEGDTTVQVNSTNGFAVGRQMTIDSGANAETRTVTNVGTAARTTSLQSSASAGDTNLKVTNVTSLNVGDHVLVDPGTGQQQVTIASVGTAGVNTTLSAASTASGNIIKVAAVTGFVAGDVLQIGTGASSEPATVQAVGTAGVSGSGLTLTANLSQAHAQGAVVLDTSKPGTGLEISPALADAHPAATAVTAPGTGVTFSPALAEPHAFAASVQAVGTGITFSPALAHAHAAGDPVVAIGTTTPRVDTPLVANPRLPVTVVATYKAVSITNPSPGVYVFDFGRDFAGWPVLNLENPTPGQNIQIVPGEGPSLSSAGLVTESWSSSNGTRYDYVPSAAKNQTWHPSFAYSGFRWLQVSGLTSPPTADTVYAEQLMTANPVASDFISSTPLLNQIDALVRNAEQANMESVLTDCPNREKAPYTGDTAQDINTELNDFDLRDYLTATERNFVESQQPNGEVLSTGPEWHTIENGTNWGGAIVEVPWAMYQAYGDTSLLSTYYSSMARYIDYVNSRATGNLVTYGLADWETPDPNPPLAAYTNSYGYYIQVEDMAKIAAVLGKTDDAKMYQTLGQNIAAAFNATYLNTTTHTYSNGDMADDALALDAGLVPADQQTAVLNHLLNTIAANNGLIMVGSISLEPIIRVLHNTGHDDVLYKWATSTAYPSYGYILAQGATTMTETWNLNPSESQDHHFLGGLDAWLTSGLAGIGQAAGTVGFSSPVIKPSVLGTTSSVTGDYTSAYGTISDSWSLAGPSSDPTGLTMKTAIPVSSPGTVEIPRLASSRVILEDGHVIWSDGKPAAGVTATVDGDYIAVSNITGTHTFTWRASR